MNLSKLDVRPSLDYSIWTLIYIRQVRSQFSLKWQFVSRHHETSTLAFLFPQQQLEANQSFVSTDNLLSYVWKSALQRIVYVLSHLHST